MTLGLAPQCSGELRANVYDATGKMLAFEITALVTGQQKSLEIGRDLPAGAYTLILEFNGKVVRRLIVALGAAKHPDDWITLISDMHSYENPPLDELSVPAPPTGVGSLDGSLDIRSIVVEGYTPIEDFSTIYSMIETLRGYDGIFDADLLGDDRLREDPLRDQRWEQYKGRLFAIEIEMEGT